MVEMMIAKERGDAKRSGPMEDMRRVPAPSTRLHAEVVGYVDRSS